MYKIGVIIPCYNEAKRLDFLEVEKLIMLPNIKIFFANDGSTDNTAEIINQFILQHNKDNLTMFDYKENTGKANTIYTTVNMLLQDDSLDYIAYLDADFATNADEFIRMLTVLKAQPLDFVIASRVNLLNSNIKRKYYRHLIGRIIVTIINFKYHLGIYDTQCGAKIFSKEILKTGFSKPFKTSWLFDIELFIRLKLNKFLIYGTEFPIRNWRDVEGSKLKPNHAIIILKELLNLYRTYK